MLASLLSDLADYGHRGTWFDLLRLRCRYQLQNLGGRLDPWWIYSTNSCKLLGGIYRSSLRDATTSKCSFTLICIRAVENLFLRVIKTCT